ncbi:MAG TPA: DUF3048 C-terminal domain-containing protein [Anaerolineaceae bacterium]|nr:DUF3048 C-terminal domain-containing protein [Anaerolineaceae bacterium]HPN53897.1 DUF3048 C-terminal domain-containing protein [Anaerolineaceae bacterium]
MRRSLLIFFILLVLTVLVISACTNAPAAAPDLSQAQTLAAQTLAAMPTFTAPVTATPLLPATNTPQPKPSITPIPPTATPAPPTATPTPIVVGPSNFPENVNPLTGLVVENPDILNRRPVMIKVANFPRVGRPHAGLSAADIVFEYWIGEGANRMMALYYGQDSGKVGPMRSGRYVDAQLVPMYQGGLGFVSAWAPVLTKLLDTLGKRAVMEGSNNCPAVCRYDPGTVVDVFADTAAFTKHLTDIGVENTRFNLDGMAFDSRAPQAGEAGDMLRVEWANNNYGEWKYDAASGKYLRWIEDVDESTLTFKGMIPLVDRNTDKQLAFSNVIVVFAQYIEYAPTLHDISILANRKGQRAVIFRDGKAIEGLWKASDAEHPMQFITADGQPLPLQPGNTWMIITGMASPFTHEGGNYLLDFALP